MKLQLSLLYRDAANYKTSFDHTVDTKDYPEAQDLKVGSEIEMGQYGTLSQDEFFESEIHEYCYNDEYDHNLLDITEITKIEE